MLQKRYLVSMLTVLVCFDLVVSKEFLRVCYFTSWSEHRKSQYAKFSIEDIDPKLCTHLIYAFGNIDKESKTLVPQLPEEDDKPGVVGKYRQFTNLKKRNSNLKTLLSIGGQNDDGSGFKAVTETPEILDWFVRTTIDFLRHRGFDGLDIDWEYPTKETRHTFVDLLKALKQGFESERASKKLILSIAGAAGKYWLEPGYDIPAIARYVDFVNLMTYDYHTKQNKVAGFNAPLLSKNSITFNPTLSMNWTVQYWRDHGLPYHKMVIGMTSVGRWYTLENENNTDPGASITQQTNIGDYYGMEDRMAYPEICVMLSSTFTVRIFDEEQQVPYMVKGSDWVGYDDAESIRVKIPWMLKLGAAGFMYWALDLDDFTGRVCESGKYPFLTAMVDAVKKEEEPVLTDNVNKNINYLTKKNGNKGTSLHQSVFIPQIIAGIIFLWILVVQVLGFH